WIGVKWIGVKWIGKPIVPRSSRCGWQSETANIMASAMSQSDRDRVLEATDLVALVGEHVALKQKGREHVGLCPFHDDRSPSLAVVTHKGDGFYKCFACGAAGNAIDFVMNFHKMPFGDALRHLAARAGIELQDRFQPRDTSGPRKDDLQRANAIGLRHYRRMLADEQEGAIARRVIADRGIGTAMVEAFQLGYAPDRRDSVQVGLKRLESHAKDTPGREAPPSIDAFVAAGLVREGNSGRNDLLRHRIVFPIFDELGRPIAFGGRKIREEDEPKYINSPESPLFHKSKSLYGIELAKQAIIKSRVAIVTEGYTDVIACHAAGFTNVVATLGTALTVEHARLLRRLCDTVILLFDGDAAGMRAADRGVEVFFSEPIDVKVCTLPRGLDPDELLREPDGAALFRAALDRSIDALAYLVQRFRTEYQSRAGLSGRQQSLEALLRRLAELGFASVSGVRKQFVMSSLAHLCGISERELEAALPTIRPRAAAATSAPIVERRDSSGTDATAASSEPSRSTGVLPTVDRARREAERALLGLLFASPELARESVELDFEGELAVLPITEALAPERFRDPEHADLYRTWLAQADGGFPPSLGVLLAELADARCKGLASDLYLEGERRRGKNASLTLDHLRTAFSDLERLDRRSRFRSARDLETTEASASATSAGTSTSGAATSSTGDLSSVPSLDLAAAQARLSRLRERGTDVTAIPRPVRG
ncbi:MAG: DNA primase, partial [Phycisphaerae bacterium]|nr:DNA primase [Phycisphaerae bacterium]